MARRNKLTNDEFIAIAHDLVGTKHGAQTRIARMIGKSPASINGIFNHVRPPSDALSRALLIAVDNERRRASMGNLAPPVPTTPNPNIVSKVNELIDPDANSSDEEILEKIARLFSLMKKQLKFGIMSNIQHSLIISGPAGVGKTYPTTKILSPLGDRLAVFTGKITPVKLYCAMWDNNSPESVILLDDCDSIFESQDGLNLIKGATDTKRERRVAWATQNSEMKAMEIPQSFVFTGAIVFITNKNLREMSEKGKNAPHIKAILNRCDHIELDIWSTRRRVLHLKNLILNEPTLMADFTIDQKLEIFDWVEKNKDRFKEDISIRSAVRIGKQIHQSFMAGESSDEWKKNCEAMYLK